MAEFEAACRMIKDLMNGRPVEWNGKELELTWAQGRERIPMYVAAYGPRALAVTVGSRVPGFVTQCPNFSFSVWVASRVNSG